MTVVPSLVQHLSRRTGRGRAGASPHRPQPRRRRGSPTASTRSRQTATPVDDGLADSAGRRRCRRPRPRAVVRHRPARQRPAGAAGHHGDADHRRRPRPLRDRRHRAPGDGGRPQRQPVAICPRPVGCSPTSSTRTATASSPSRPTFPLPMAGPTSTPSPAWRRRAPSCTSASSSPGGTRSSARSAPSSAASRSTATAGIDVVVALARVPCSRSARARSSRCCRPSSPTIRSCCTGAASGSDSTRWHRS